MTIYVMRNINLLSIDIKFTPAHSFNFYQINRYGGATNGSLKRYYQCRVLEDQDLEFLLH